MYIITEKLTLFLRLFSVIADKKGCLIYKMYLLKKSCVGTNIKTSHIRLITLKLFLKCHGWTKKNYHIIPTSY